MNKIYDAIMGLVVGDALGVPVEFRQRDTFTITDMTGYGTYNQPVGTWSDDSSMTLATIESIVQCEKIDPADIMKKFSEWYRCGLFTPYGQVFDVGGATKRAILKYLHGAPIDQCGGRKFTDNGNGALMRILPLVFVKDLTADEVRAVSGLTHAHQISWIACEIYLGFAWCLWHGANPKQALEALQDLPDEFKRLPDVANLKREDIRSSGFVIDTLEAAVWCLMTTDNYKDCVLTAVNLGEDTDTVAAVAGGLAGILYGVGGENGIPEEWIAQIARKGWIKDLCDQFFETVFDQCV